MTDTNGGADLESAQVAKAEMEVNPHTEVEPLSAAHVEQQKWPGWPGDNVFRLIVPVTKVGSIIGRKGEFIKKICEETRAKVRILEGAIGTPERIHSETCALETSCTSEVSKAQAICLMFFFACNLLASYGQGGQCKLDVTLVAASWDKVLFKVASSVGYWQVTTKGNEGKTNQVLISAREELETALSPAMDAALRVFKRVNDISEDDGPSTLCSVKLLIASSQAISLIGKQGASVKAIQDNSGAGVRILAKEELPYYATAEERIVDIQGETSKALKALEAVLAHLRKFLVDHSILPLFEKSVCLLSLVSLEKPSYYSRIETHLSISFSFQLVPPAAQDQAKDPRGDKTQSLIHSAQQTGSGKDFSVSSNLLHMENRIPIDLPYQRARLSIYGQDPSSAIRTPALGRTASSLISQVLLNAYPDHLLITQTMQVPLSYAEEIIGIGGGNISFIRRTSGAVIALEESRTVPDEIVIEIKGNSTQVQTAQQLIEDVVTGHKEPAPRSYSSYDTDYRSSYANLSGSGYLSSPFRGYGSSSLGGYGAYRH
ncbi:hypothetical protein ZIOFF_007491 [Zingiber officinale]|uniref:K Homology domain-containing protein n=1 Tax=Zingiber officinale TaxID=94328 RepID=A0A8J5I502_ZINOF|nr:hypothetical protein ZIOFF_007491 [Zingiber officinale]